MIKKVHIPENKREKNPAGNVDKMFARETNFVEVKSNQTLQYGGKTLQYLGLMEDSCLFEFKNGNLSQRFIVNPRYYMSKESDSGNGEGLYEFRPLNNESKLYSQV